MRSLKIPEKRHLASFSSFHAFLTFNERRIRDRKTAEAQSILIERQFRRSKIWGRSMIRYTFGLIAIATLASGASPSSAETGASTVVSYQDLNMATGAGAATLKRRVNLAVRAVCPESGSRDLAQMAEVNACRREARRTSAMQVASVVGTAQRLASGDQTTLLASR